MQSSYKKLASVEIHKYSESEQTLLVEGKSHSLVRQVH